MDNKTLTEEQYKAEVANIFNNLRKDIDGIVENYKKSINELKDVIINKK